ncbi:TPA: S26 family signal peptidase [Enterobacter hormaechei]|nr:S26 family signal peptidase [Enterobacter hormaechei]HDV8319615.1 S26 family signal peptidase [Enterobacter hormaechei]
MMILKHLATRIQLSDESRAYLNTTTIALSLVLAYSLFTHILIPATHSVFPVVLFRTGHEATEQDQYVRFYLKDRYLPRGEANLVKRLGCIAGQYLQREGNQFYCDGVEIARAMAHDHKGNALPVFNFTGIIPEGKAFAVGDTINSYDSRYWGFIDIATTEKLIPVF